MIKQVILTILFVTFVFTQTIDQTLQKKIEQNPQELIPIIITMKNSISVSKVLAENPIAKDAFNYRHQIAVIMQNKAQRSQHWLKTLCQNRNFGVEAYTSFWIVNMVSMKASATAIKEIAKQPSVKEIFLNQEHTFVDYKISRKQTRSTWGLEKIGSKSANKNGNGGKGILVAVIDTGVNYLHDDLKGRVLNGKDFANNDDDPIDDNGHGTHCSGTVAGTTFGVAPQATILAIKVMAKNGGGTWDNIVKGVQYAASYNKDGKSVDIVSMSLGGPSPIKKILRDAFDNALAMGLRFAVAAGNSGHFKSTIDSPGDQKDVVTVGATNFRNWIAPFSSRGPVIKYGEPYIKPDVVAPGVDVTSCWIGGTDNTRTISGTSMATPHVAGTMALLLEKNPNATQSLLLEVLEKTAKDLGNQGKDNKFGSGLINVPDALKNLPMTKVE